MAEILIAEDREEQLALIEIFLQSDHQIGATAQNGAEAIGHLYVDQFDVVVVDLNMPKFDGIQVTKAAKALQPEAGVILSTVVVNESELTEANAAGVDTILHKPYSKGKLLDMVERVAN